MAGARRRVLRAAAGAILAVAAILSVSGLRLFSGGTRDSDAASWRERVIPLPKELAVEDVLRLDSAEIGLVNEAGGGPLLETAEGILSRFAKGGPEEGRFLIVLALTGPGGRLSKNPDSPRLRGLPNPGQAYMISPLPGHRGLLLAANAPLGLLYAARTLEQLTEVESGREGRPAVTLPLARVVDWPDIAERGQWGGDAAARLEGTAELKLNHLEINSGVALDAAGRPVENVDRELLRRGSELGVKIVPYVLHLEQLSRYAGLAGRPDITATPDPSKPLPSDYAPGLCMTSPATRGLIRGWLEKIAAVDGVTDVCVWLSEDAAPCFCERCRGREPFSVEVEAIVAASREVRKAHPLLKLRLLTTQGSYPVNDRVLAAAPPEVGITYYDGGRTYDSSRRPMIYPLLEAAARSGRALGVYPQITHSWRCVFPWTGPQFVNARAQEFAGKGLKSVVGYAVPSNACHPFNVAALAEWTWNAWGRSPGEFCRAYARLAGYADPGLFARWAIPAGNAGWTLAETKLFLTSIYNPSLGLAARAPFERVFEGAEALDAAHLAEAIGRASAALELARESGRADMITESRCVLAGLEAFGALRRAAGILSAGGADATGLRTLGAALDMVDDRAAVLRAELLAWGERLNKESGWRDHTGRLLDTAFALLSTADEFRARAAAPGIADPRPETRLTKVGAWTAEDFGRDGRTTLRFDVGRIVPPAGGRWQAGFDFVDGAYGTGIEAVSLVVPEGGTDRVIAAALDPPTRVSVYERHKEVRLDVPGRDPGLPLMLQVEVTGPPADAPAGRRSCAGTAGLRFIGPLPSADAAPRLSGLSISPGEPPLVFHTDWKSYLVRVKNRETSVSVTAWTADPESRLAIAGRTARSGEPSGPILVEVGLNVVPLEIISADGSRRTPYTLRIVRSHPLPNWVRETGGAPWTPRDSAGELVFKNRMWLLGGYLPKVVGDVWSSGDGRAWERAGEVPDASGVNIPVNFVHAGRMWVASNDGRLYATRDGKAWELVNADPPWKGRYAAGGAVFRGRMWVAGGLGGGKLFNDVWSSADGLEWRLETSAAPWAPRQLFSLFVVFRDRLWIVGGGVTSYHPFQSFRDVWSSADGKNWKRETDEAPWPGRVWTSAVVYANRLWLLGGFRAEPTWNNFDDAWYSADGASWRRLETEDAWSPRHEFSAYVFQDKLWVVAGNSWPLQNDAWSLDIPGLTFLTTPVVECYAGTEYLYRARADFNRDSAPVRFRIVDGPDWLSIDPATGALRGTPPGPGEAAVTIEAFDRDGEAARQSFRIRVIGL